MKVQILLFMVLISSFEAANYNILAIWPVASRTQFSLSVALFNKLAEVGHNVTLISPYEQIHHENIKMIKLDGASEAALNRKSTNFNELLNLSTVELMKMNAIEGAAMTEFFLQHEKFKEIIQSDEKFDLFMIDVHYNDVLLAIPYYLDIPVVAFSSVGPNLLTNEMTKNPINPASNPSILLGFGGQMSFFERLKNTAVTVAELFHYYFSYLPHQELLLRKYFGDIIVKKNFPKVIDLVHSVNLVLHNSHPIMQPAQVHAPNSVEIGGFQLKTEDDEIHPDLNAMLDRAVAGIIYFSLGGNFRSADLPESTLNAFVNVFSSMRDVLVMWKFETVDLKERHAHNIVIGPSMPQQEILSHKNLRAFITHGGLLSLMEAVHYGKPVIGVPFFNDQKFNMAQASSQGYGIILDYNNITESSLQRAIDAIFNDTSYRENAERMSANFKDSPIKALDKAVWYIEHVINSKGAHHLRTAATKLSFAQIHLIDQIFFALMLIFAVIVALSKAVKFTKEKFQKRNKFMFSSSSQTHTSKKAAVSAIAKRNKLKAN